MGRFALVGSRNINDEPMKSPSTGDPGFISVVLDFLRGLDDFLWKFSPAIGDYDFALTMVLIVVCGGYISLRLLPQRYLGQGLKILFVGAPPGEGQIAPRKALATSLAGTVGTGNVTGVAVAIGLGGPGALFWMWIAALLGMATKYAEALLAVRYRQTDGAGNFYGGPMYYIEKGLGKSWRWLAIAYAGLGAITAVGTGNLTQSHSMADSLDNIGVPPLVSAGLLLVLTGAVILGGLKRIADSASALVPSMIILYILMALFVLGLNVEAIPAAFVEIFSGAFNGTSATGGFVGASIAIVISQGIARGTFSNEAGMGSSAIVHATAKTDNPARQGTLALVGTFIDTIVVCTITGLVIVTTGAWESGEKGIDLTVMAFGTATEGGFYLPYSSFLIALVGSLLAFTTVLGWAFYGERMAHYLFGDKIVFPFRVFWSAATVAGPIILLVWGSAGVDLVWLIANITTAAIVIPNLIGVIMLSPVVLEVTRQFVAKIKDEPKKTSVATGR